MTLAVYVNFISFVVSRLKCKSGIMPTFPVYPGPLVLSVVIQPLALFKTVTNMSSAVAYVALLQ